MSEPYRGLNAALARSAAPAERFAAVLAEHETFRVKRHADNPWRYDGTHVCTCGDEFTATDGIGGSFVAHRAHLAAALAAVADDGLAERFPRVQGLCPRCDGASLFLGADGYVTCSRIECSNPSAASELLGVRFPAPSADRDERDGA